MNPTIAIAHSQRSRTGPVLTQKMFEMFGRFITHELGIKMPDIKRGMLQSRLQKRLRQLKLHDFKIYHDYLFSKEGHLRELQHFLDIVTTNKTDFFREPHHYPILIDTVLPELMQQKGIGLRRPVNIWSAGCSTGAEPYTLAMLLDAFKQKHRGFTYQILATDVSERVLDIARKAVYEEKEAASIPLELKKKYLLRSKDRNKPKVRIAPEVRRRVTFKHLNLMDQDYRLGQVMDIILCRNVIIYFDRTIQYKVLKRINHCLKDGGYLFIGHSETLNGFDLPLNQISANVYCK